MPKISIIIPAYNVEAYIEECILSILRQDFHDYEILLIDDCSLDGTVQVIKEYEKNYPERIRGFYRTSNHKQGGARNIGIKNAKGEYLMFVDSDDRLGEKALLELWDNANTTMADIIFGDYFIFDNKTEERRSGSHVSGSVTGKLIADKKKALLNTSVVPWAKLIKRSLITDNDLFFPKDMFYEDQATTYLYYLYAKSASKVNKEIYAYREREDSTTHVLDYDREFQRLLSAELLIKRVIERGFFDTYREEMEFFCVYQGYCLSVEAWFLAYKKVLDDLLNRAMEFLCRYGGDYINNRYYRTGLSKHYQMMIEAGKKSNAELRNLMHSGVLKEAHTNYSYQLCYCADKIRNLKEYILSDGIRTVLWGAGKTGGNIVRAFGIEGLQVTYVTDLNEKVYGKHLENYVVCRFEEIEQDVDMVIAERTEHIKEIARSINNKIPILDLEIYMQYDLGKEIEQYLQ